MKQAVSTKRAGEAVVTRSNELITCRLIGYITGDIVKDSMRRTRALATEVRTEGKKPLLLIDISGITSQTSAARSEAKRLKTFGLQRIAVCGGGKAITIVGKYIAKAGGMSSYTKFFRTEKLARQWLYHLRSDGASDANYLVRPILSLLVMLACTGVIVGWAIDNQTLKAWLADSNPMNPTNAVIFIVIALAFMLWRKKRMSMRRQTILTGIGVLCIVWGGTLILRSTFGWDLSIDRQLFESKLSAQDSVASHSSLDFLLLGGMILIVLNGMAKVWQQWLFHALSIILFVTTFGSIFGVSFGLDRLYGGNFIPMVLITAVVFLLFNYSLQTVAKPLPFFARRMDDINKYWRPVTVAVALMFMVGLAWQQSRQEIHVAHDTAVAEAFSRSRDAIVDRFATYTNVLMGYKGLFASSDFVSAPEYQRYFTSSQMQGGYTDLTAISFIRAVPKVDEQSFIAEIRSQANEVPAFGNYTVYPKTENQALYPLVYIGPASNTSYGFDLGTSSVRLAALEKARDTGLPVASGEIDLNASNTNGSRPKRSGFFMTIPIYKVTKGLSDPVTVEDRRATIYGFINTVFENDRIFGDIFKQESKDQKIRVTITNVSDDKTLFTFDPKKQSYGDQPKAQDVLAVGGQQWRIALYAPDDFGSTGLAREVPYLILIGGSLLTLLAFAFLVSQVRQRDRALDLANAMTEDLQTERNEAVVARQKDEAILASIGDAVFAVDGKNRIVLFNPAAETISGYSREEAIGMPYDEILRFIYEKDRRPNKSFITKALSGHMANMKNHTKLIRKDGHEVYVADSAAPIRDDSSNVVGAIVVFRDVSKELQLEQAKSEFVSLASHQLRTPLSAINWYAEMLLAGDAGKLGEEQQTYVREIYEGNHRMIELVDSLLNVSRLEVGKLKNEPQHVSMIELAASLEKEMQTTIVTKKLTLHSNLDKTISTVYADPKLLRMIVQNLLSNAVKYTPDEGEVTLTMRPASKSEVSQAKLRPGQAYLFMSVKDTGYGIPKDQQPKIFGKLFRADNVRKLDVEGTGLGLYIIKEVTQKLGGVIWFESTESLGTTFYVILPFETKPS